MDITEVYSPYQKNMSGFIIANRLYDEEIVMKFSFSVSAFDQKRSSRTGICFPTSEFKVKTAQLLEAVCDTLTILHVI